jgi:hypothetical protein
MRALAILLLATLTAAAQSPLQNWTNVKTLSPGTEIRVDPASAAAVRGRLRNVTDETLVVTSGKGEEMFTRLQIGRVSIRGKGHRRRNTLIGLGVGAGVGLGIGLASRAGANQLTVVPNTVVTAAGMVGGAVIGTIIGVAIPTGGWREVYRR